MKWGLKTMKGKVVAGMVGVGILTGSGVVLAGSGAGDHLREWYEGMFGDSVATIEDDVTTYGESKLPELEAEYEQLKNDASLDIDLMRERLTSESLEEIVAAKIEHLESLDGESREILDQMGLEFYNVFLDGYGEIQRLSDEGLNYASEDLTNYTGELGQEARNQITSDLTAAKQEAVTDLETAIQNAQDQIEAELRNQEEITTRNLKNQIDWAVEDVRQVVTALLANLMEEQQMIITQTAQILEDEAKEALDDVVSGINE
ncbi:MULTISPECIES: hypothetical protein [Virgibacillus]|uniref:Uncharacterized protein n=1 Tax=Virgibacillus dokdonensis TaxID=302167 RepID=A0A2K9IZC2_9BACI|nr:MULTISPECIES: hypothetical protein [Virgibacillus]AUJ25016.1 hypothetical protein A21D_01935 [Virgibacillus dokdonensis]NWO13431.1 hypothetical protein [Virgibacillus sp.]